MPGRRCRHFARAPNEQTHPVRFIFTRSAVAFLRHAPGADTQERARENGSVGLVQRSGEPGVQVSREYITPQVRAGQPDMSDDRYQRSFTSLLSS
jgi:hypothetical protein